MSDNPRVKFDTNVVNSCRNYEYIRTIVMDRRDKIDNNEVTETDLDTFRTDVGLLMQESFEHDEISAEFMDEFIEAFDAEFPPDLNSISEEPEIQNTIVIDTGITPDGESLESPEEEPELITEESIAAQVNIEDAHEIATILYESPMQTAEQVQKEPLKPENFSERAEYDELDEHQKKVFERVKRWNDVDRIVRNNDAFCTAIAALCKNHNITIPSTIIDNNQVSSASIIPSSKSDTKELLTAILFVDNLLGQYRNTLSGDNRQITKAKSERDLAVEKANRLEREYRSAIERATILENESLEYRQRPVRMLTVNTTNTFHIMHRQEHKFFKSRSIGAGLRFRDGHLRLRDFFETEVFSEAYAFENINQAQGLLDWLLTVNPLLVPIEDVSAYYIVQKAFR